MKVFPFFILLIICNTGFCQAVKDTLFFNNGSLLIGEIKKVKLGVVTFDPDDANDVTVQLRKLKTIGAGRTIFRVETIDQGLYFGRLLPSTTPNSSFVKSGADSNLINLQSISILYPFHRSIAERFDGSVGLGYNYTRSSGFGRLNLDGSLSYVYKQDELNVSASAIYTITDSVFTRDRESFAVKNNYYIRQNWFFTAFLAYQRNLELGLKRRFQEGVGFGNKFLTSYRYYSWGRVGLVLNQEKSTDDIGSGTLAEVFGQLEMNVFRFEKPELNVLLTESFFYNLSQSGRFRNDGSINTSIEVFKDFDLSLEFYNSYDSEPPGTESHKFDFGIVFGLKYKF